MNPAFVLFTKRTKKYVHVKASKKVTEPCKLSYGVGFGIRDTKEDEEGFNLKKGLTSCFSRITWWPAGLIMINKVSNKLK